ncbi:MAG: MATE family efflux transporter [Bacteroidales bacterium]|nr:MATE family efflux transporter [Bacteroidales bacterium]
MAESVQGKAPTELETKKISTLLKEYAVPGIIAMTASSLYNIVDSVYIGHIKDVGALAISGLAVTFPIMNLGTAIGTLVGVGASTLVSILLGQKNYVTANKVLPNVVTLNVVLGALFGGLILAFLKPVLFFFGASEAIYPFARDYMVIILAGFIVTHLYFGLNGMIRATGNPKLAMGLTLFTVISNAILDPIFIFGLGLGVKGAAIATVICQTLSLIYSLVYFSSGKNVIHFGKRIFGFSSKIARTSMGIGLGPFLMNTAACLVAMFINQQLRKYGGDLAIGAYGIINRISFMFVMIIMGLNQGMQPIASYNYGAGKGRRVKEVYWLCVKWATLVSIVAFIIFEVFPGPAAGMFTNDPELRGLAVHGMRLMNCLFPIIGFQIISTNLFQCLGMVKKSVFLSLSRQLIFLLPALYLLPLAFGIEGVWLSYPVSDVLAFTCTVILIIRLIRQLERSENPQ